MKIFDPKIYDIEFEKFVFSLQNRILHNAQELQKILAPVCSQIGVEKITAKKIPIKKSKFLHGELFSVFYDNGDSDENRFLEFSETIATISETKYTFFQKKGDEDWKDEIKNRITVLQKFFASCCTHDQIESYTKYIQNHDLRFDVKNLHYILPIISQAIKEKKIDEYGLAVFNVCKFSALCKQHGEDSAVKILEKFFFEISNLVGKDGTVASLGGDEGVVFFKKSRNIELLDYMRSAIVPIDEIGNELVSIGCHIGVNLELSGATNPRDIISDANRAMRVARQSSVAKVTFYDEKLREKTERQLKIEQNFMNALKNEEFQVYYQPKVDLKTYTLIGAEALVRWMHEGNIIFPDSFIPILESNNSVKYLDMYMLKHICQDLRRWIDEGKNVVQISVNLSRCSMTIPNLIEMICGTIDTYKIPRSLIQIELTESAADVDPAELKKLVYAMRDEGLATAVDDFGTGFSSLSLIRELPWKVLKIDKSLLHGAQKEGSNEQLVFKSIISMAKGLGLECIVEGVETREDIKILKQCDCFLAQGYYFDRPIPKIDFETLISTNSMEAIQTVDL